MPTTTIDKPAPPATSDRTGEGASHDPNFYTDQDPTLYPEAVVHLLTPGHRRTLVAPETLAAMRAAVGES